MWRQWNKLDAFLICFFIQQGTLFIETDTLCSKLKTTLRIRITDLIEM